MDTFTHHLSVMGHGGTIGTGFPINKGSADDSSPQRIHLLHHSCHETTTRAARLERVVLVTLRRFGFVGLRGARVSRRGVVSTVATLPRVKGPMGFVRDEAW